MNRQTLETLQFVSECSKTGIAKSKSHECFRFPLQIKVIFIVYIKQAITLCLEKGHTLKNTLLLYNAKIIITVTSKATIHKQ